MKHALYADCSAQSGAAQAPAKRGSKKPDPGSLTTGGDETVCLTIFISVNNFA